MCAQSLRGVLCSFYWGSERELFSAETETEYLLFQSAGFCFCVSVKFQFRLDTAPNLLRHLSITTGMALFATSVLTLLGNKGTKLEREWSIPLEGVEIRTMWSDLFSPDIPLYTKGSLCSPLIKQEQFLNVKCLLCDGRFHRLFLHLPYAKCDTL